MIKEYFLTGVHASGKIIWVSNDEKSTIQKSIRIECSIDRLTFNELWGNIGCVVEVLYEKEILQFVKIKEKGNINNNRNFCSTFDI